MKKLIFNILVSILNWLKEEIIKFFQNLAKDIRSLRYLLNWVYCIFYLWLCWYSVKHNPDSMNTAIVTTGGIISIIFTNYVISKTYEKKIINIKKEETEDNGQSD